MVYVQKSLVRTWLLLTGPRSKLLINCGNNSAAAAVAAAVVVVAVVVVAASQNEPHPHPLARFKSDEERKEDDDDVQPSQQPLGSEIIFFLFFRSQEVAQAEMSLPPSS